MLNCITFDSKGEPPPHPTPPPPAAVRIFYPKCMCLKLVAWTIFNKKMSLMLLLKKDLTSLELGSTYRRFTHTDWGACVTHL